MSETTGCEECKKRDSRGYQWFIVFLGFYLIFSSVYGSVILFEKLMSIFK